MVSPANRFRQRALACDEITEGLLLIVIELQILRASSPPDVRLASESRVEGKKLTVDDAEGRPANRVLHHECRRRKVSRHFFAVSNSENRLPSCSTR